MLFNSFTFLFAFLPVVFALSYIIPPKSLSYKYLLIASSLIFYLWWYPPFLLLFLGSIGLNYLFGLILERYTDRRLLLFFCLLNLLPLIFYKYLDFLLANLAIFSDIFTIQKFSGFEMPLGISFYTFQQITYLVDLHHRKIKRPSFIDYVLYISFFPQLIAGPIVRKKQFFEQWNKIDTQRNEKFITAGITIFTLGLAQKVLLADNLSKIVTPLFAKAETTSLTFAEGWIATLGFGQQIYFDFAGYSAMAIGLGMMFGIRLPQNFNSPYKARNIQDFWQRWHITLSSFLRDYLYIPLGGNRHGEMRASINVFITMILGGLWHGAGWTFILWGALHACYIVISRITAPFLSLSKIIATSITFLAVLLAWIPFRSDNMTSVYHIYKALFSPWTGWYIQLHDKQWFFFLLALFCALALPNISQIILGTGQKRTSRYIPVFRPSLFWLVTVIAFLGASLYNMGSFDVFIYFQF